MDKELQQALERPDLDLAKGERAAEACLAELRMQAEALFFKKIIAAGHNVDVEEVHSRDPRFRDDLVKLMVEGRVWWDTWWLENESRLLAGADANTVADNAVRDYGSALH